MAEMQEGQRKDESVLPKGTVNVPAMGKTKKTYVYAGVAVVGVLAVVYYRHRNAGGTAAGSTATVTDPDGNVCSMLNPATGFCPGTPGDLNAQASQTATNAFSGSSGTPDSGIVGYDSQGNPIYGTTTGQQVTTGPPFASNAAWAQYATGYLVDTLGDNSSTIGAALGAYLAGQEVDAQQESVINQAIAYAGAVPVAAANHFPPSIKVKGSKEGGKTYADNPVTGIRVTNVQMTDATVSWHASPHATFYTIKVEEGKKTVRTQDSTSPTSHISGLSRDTKYDVTVLANPAKPSAHRASASFTTTKHPAAKK